MEFLGFKSWAWNLFSPLAAERNYNFQILVVLGDWETSGRGDPGRQGQWRELRALASLPMWCGRVRRGPLVHATQSYQHQCGIGVPTIYFILLFDTPLPARLAPHLCQHQFGMGVTYHPFHSSDWPSLPLKASLHPRRPFARMGSLGSWFSSVSVIGEQTK